jgi:lipoprotein-releasing system permease protein
LNLELFIAHRISNGAESKKKLSQSIIKIATLAISLSLIIMILSVAIITGFQNEIREKVVGFGSHITIMNHDNNTSYETVPINKNQDFYPAIENTEGIKHIQVFGIKAGIIKTKTDIQGVVLKGIREDFDWTFFEKNIVEGTHFVIKDTTKLTEVIISEYLSNLLKLNVGDNLFMYFVQDPVRLGKYKIVGIYNTGLEDHDMLYVICDLKVIQDLNYWDVDGKDLISGFEITIDNYKDLEKMTEIVNNEVGITFNEDGSKLKVENIKDRNPQIFDWLALTNTNVWVILILMIIVSTINMISGLLIIILEGTNLIGILKALGSSDWSIRKIFLYNSVYIIGKGLFWGNLIGLFLCALQYYFEIIPLDPTSYYVDTVPINLNFFHILLLNTGTIVLTFLALILPSYLITKIDPVKAIRFN